MFKNKKITSTSVLHTNTALPMLKCQPFAITLAL